MVSGLANKYGIHVLSVTANTLISTMEDHSPVYYLGLSAKAASAVMNENAIGMAACVMRA